MTKEQILAKTLRSYEIRIEQQNRFMNDTCLPVLKKAIEKIKVQQARIAELEQERMLQELYAIQLEKDNSSMLAKINSAKTEVELLEQWWKQNGKANDHNEKPH